MRNRGDHSRLGRNDWHQRAAEFHDLAAHAHRVAAMRHGQEDHQNRTRTFETGDGILSKGSPVLTRSS